MCFKVIIELITKVNVMIVYHQAKRLEIVSFWRKTVLKMKNHESKPAEKKNNEYLVI